MEEAGVEGSEGAEVVGAAVEEPPSPPSLKKRQACCCHCGPLDLLKSLWRLRKAVVGSDMVGCVFVSEPWWMNEW